MRLKISEIKVGENRREIDESNVANLVKSIKEIGLINPITVTENHKLVAGAHRLEAYKRMGLNEIECNVVQIDGLKAELAEIDENLIRHNLNHIDEGEQLLRKKEIYETLYPETKVGAAQGLGMKRSAKSNLTEPNSARSQKSFVDDTADKMQITPRAIRQKIQIVKNLAPEVKTIVKENGISEKNSLKLARIKEPDKQREAAKNLVKGKPIEEISTPKSFRNSFQEAVSGLKSGHSRPIMTEKQFMMEYTAFVEDTVHRFESYAQPVYAEIYPSLSEEDRKEIAALTVDVVKAAKKIDEMMKGQSK